MMAECIKGLLRKVFSRKTKKTRVHLRNPRWDLPCEWCKNVVYTTEEEIWSIADPTGHIVRMCVDCRSACAGG
jgi:hypothetical protein